MRIYIIAILLLGVAACSTTPVDPTQDWTPERFYSEAKAAMKAKNYQTAIQHFETLEARYPYGPYAEQAQLEVAYAYYKNDERELAVAAADRFIRLHPTHPHVDYAFYLKGLIYFNDGTNALARLLHVGGDITDRDPKAMQQAYDTFKELVQRYPGSRYARDARQRMTYLYDAMAQYEVKVARFYYERDAYVAAVNRTRYVLENYQRTAAVEDALGIQVLAYGRMGLKELMEDSQRVLRKNFPNSRYLRQSQPAAAIAEGD